MNCPNCQQLLSPGAVFCGNCGFQINANPQSQPQAAENNVVSPLQGTTVPQAATPAPTPPNQPVFQQSFTEQPTPTANYAAVPLSQPVYGGVAVGTMPLAAPNALDNNPTQNNGKAIAAFVLGMLGLIGWLIPIVGVILGILAIIFGTISIHSGKRVLAIIGIILAIPVLALSIFFWVKNAQTIIKANGGSTSTSSSLQSISTPCFTTKVSTSFKITKTTGSCTFTAVDSGGSEEYVVKVLQVPQLTAANLDQSSQPDITNVVQATPGGQASNQHDTTFSGSKAYQATVKSSNGSAGILEYIYQPTSQGNLVLIGHDTASGKNYDLTSIENNWNWQ